MNQPSLAISQRGSAPDYNKIHDSVEPEDRIIRTLRAAQLERRVSTLLAELLQIRFDHEMLETLAASGSRVPVILLEVHVNFTSSPHDSHPLVQATVRTRDCPSDLACTPESADTDLDGAMTARERSVLQLICQGLSNKKIARDLNIAPETVKSHTKHIFGKLRTNTRAQAVAHAAKMGLL